ncbi:hypothetical protein ACE1B6_20300 [Aerosakkonemataceae cyanobacterium BLCC-F154]|uniref:Uncharacterized protein n=1 Tax=Floridaenema fluviatile BLCC-F154 TaxID=3153640 RepID=A0ABV4YFJ1_9CYAN
MSSHQPPAHLRYLKARLRPLLRPQVWGTIIFLMVVSTFAGIYFANLEEFIADENQGDPTVSNESNSNYAEDNQASESKISPEDRAIAADIDISTVLENDLAASAETFDAAPEKPKQNIFEQYMRQRQEKNKAANSSQEQTNQQPAAANTDDNPFTIKFPTVNNAGRNNAASSPNPFLYNLPSGNSSGLNSPDTTTNLNNKNALQTALDRANGYNNQRNIDANGNEINPLQSALDRQQNSTNNPSNSTSTTNQPGQSNVNLIAQPNQIRPLLGTTPYNNSGATTTTNNGLPIQGSVPLTPYSNVTGNTTLPTQIPTTGVPSNIPNTANPGLTNNVPNSYTYINQPQVPTTTTTVPSTSGVNSGIQTAPTQVQNTPAPFSVPRTPPGRTIGGGQINTFSNP